MTAAGRTMMSQSRRIAIVLVLNAALIVGLIVAGVLSRSIAVFAAAGDAAADCIGLALGLIAIRLRDRRGADPSAQRPVALVALFNSVFLLAVTAAVVVESVLRLLSGSPAVVGLPMLIVSVVTVVVMLTGAIVLGRSAASEDVHMRSVLLDALADAAAAAGVAAAGLVIFLTRSLYWLDPVLALVIAVVIAVAAVQLCRRAVRDLRHHVALAGEVEEPQDR